MSTQTLALGGTYSVPVPIRLSTADCGCDSRATMTSAEDSNPNARSTDPAVWLDEHGDYLYRYAYVRLGRKTAAEDAVQETFLAALKAVDRYSGSTPVRYWLRGILRHKIADHFRKSSRETTVEDPEAVATMNGAFFKLSGMVTYDTEQWEFDPRKVMDRKAFMDVVGDCVTCLKGPAKQVFVLRELEGRKTEEIADELGIKPNYVWVLLHRARAQLQTCIRGKWNAGSREEGDDVAM